MTFLQVEDVYTFSNLMKMSRVGNMLHGVYIKDSRTEINLFLNTKMNKCCNIIPYEVKIEDYRWFQDSNSTFKTQESHWALGSMTQACYFSSCFNFESSLFLLRQQRQA